MLARKYRPASFADLIGQDAMVRTISNAFELGRIPQAWILTGVRGVGKTTTARILARALNYELPDGSVKGPTITMPAMGVHDAAIMESRHPDVLEMDAASHNSVEDVRQINDAIRYAPMSARYKVYILDEVHMLSGAAFNALLKTLEEPPPHAKFIFATTEIGKVPVTVLSRCQRFDLRRVDAALLVKHLEGIAAKEKIEAEPEALALIARAAEGSVRDALSLFDQAIAHAGAGTETGAGQTSKNSVRAEDVRQMLGLADRVRVVDLFEALMQGDAAAALKELRAQYDIGADPAVVLSDLAEFTHFVTRVKVVPSVADDVSLSEAERVRGRAFATQLSMRVLSRAWQMLLKGISEVKEAGRPLAAAEMVLVRIAYAADLPTPDEVVRSLGEGGGDAVAKPQGNGNGPSAPNYTPRYEAPRGSPRSSAAVSPRLAEEPAGDPVAQGRADAVDQFVRAVDRARGRKTRRAGQARVAERRAAGALRGRPARDRARGQCAEGPGARAATQDFRLDRQALDRGGVQGRGRADHARADGCQAGRGRARRAERPAGAGGVEPLSRRQGRRRDAGDAGGRGSGAGWSTRKRGRLMVDFMGMMKQAAQLQSKMQELQAELDTIEVEGTAGGGIVTVKLNAKGEMRSVKIDDALIKPDEKEILEDLLVAAHADARRKAEAVMQDKMKSLTGGLPLPPGLGLG